MHLAIHYISPFILYKKKVYQLNRQILKLYTKCTFWSGRRAPLQLHGCVPIDSSPCVIMMDYCVGFWETSAGHHVLTSLPFPFPVLLLSTSLQS